MIAAAPEVLDRLRKICGLLGSSHEGEQLAAVNRANALIAQNGWTWNEIINLAASPTTRPPSSRMVPAGTCCRLRVQLRPGPDGPLMRSNDPKSRAKYLLCAFTVIAPTEFAGMTFRDRFGTHGKDGKPVGYYAEQGREHIRRMASGAGITIEQPEDLNGIEIMAIVGVRRRSFKNVTGETENHITGIVVPGETS